MESDNIEKTVLENRKLIKENKKLLKKIDSRGKRAAFFGIVKIVIFLLVTFGLYVYLMPIVTGISNTYESITNTINSTKDLIDGSPLGSLNNIFGGSDN